MPNLIVERGREKGQSFELAAGSNLVVGRDPDSAQVVIADIAASRRHFQVSARNGKWFVADLGSKNSTYLNEAKIDKETELAPGDQIQVGETVFTFVDDLKADDKAAGLQGKEIGGYKILERIGRGGMGTVFKAKQVSLNRLVALKFLSPKLSKDPAFVDKFFAEARAAAQLNHPNVVQVFDVGTLGGVNYFSMEFMEGGCVQDLLSAREDSRLPWQEALHLIVESVRGLVFAEKRGIIHRDIKPDNLMLTSEQKVKIGDLGLATSAESTTEKGIFGTPHFIAPEQAQGKEVTHAADLYSLGATFYRVVCGKTPFTGTTVKDILRAQINDPHQPVLQIVPDFPPELAAIIDKLMAKKVENRYQSATKLLEDLEAFQLAHQIELAGGIKSRKPFFIALGVVLVALAGVIYYAATREDKVIDRTIVETRTIREQPTGTQMTDEDRRLAAEAKAKDDYYPVYGRDAKLGEIELKDREAWDGIQKDYDALRTKHPEGGAILETAEKRAAEIRTKVDQLDTLQKTVVAAANAWWQKITDDIKVAVGSGRWTEAILKSKAAAEGTELATHKQYLAAGADTWFAGIPDDCYKAATDEHSSTLSDADRLLSEDKVVDAIGKVEGWEKRLRDQNFANPELGPIAEKFVLLTDQAKAWREQKSEAIRTRLLDLVKTDKALFVETYRKVRHLPGAADADGGPVFSYRFADAAKELRAGAEGRIKSHIYRDRVEATAVRLTAAQAAWDAWTKLLADKQLWTAAEEIKGVPGVAQGTKVSVDDAKPATGTEVWVVLSLGGGGGGGSTKRALQFDDFTPAEIWKIFLAPKIDKIPQDLSHELSKLFALLGDETACGLLYDRAKAPPEQVGWVQAELRAMQDFDRLAQPGTMQPAEQIRGVDAWRGTHYRSDFFLLVDGRTPEEAPQLFPKEEIDRFVERFGAK